MITFPVTVTHRQPISESSLLYLKAFDAEAKAIEHRAYGRAFQAACKQREFEQMFMLAIVNANNGK